MEKLDFNSFSANALSMTEMNEVTGGYGWYIDFVIGVLENAEAIFGASGQIIREGGTHCTQMAFK